MLGILTNLEVTYIEDLKVTVNNKEDEKCVRQKVNKLTKLTSININSKVSLSSGDAGIMRKINTDRLTDLSVTAPGALQAVADSIQRFTALQQLFVDHEDDDDDDDDDDDHHHHHDDDTSRGRRFTALQQLFVDHEDDDDDDDDDDDHDDDHDDDTSRDRRFTALQQLHVDDTSRDSNKLQKQRILSSLRNTSLDSNKLQAQRILSSLRNNNNIKQVSLCVPGLDDRIIKEKLNMKVKLKVKEDTLSKGSLREAVRGLDFTGGLYKLDLSDNYLRAEGESLGKLMARMTATCMNSALLKNA